MLDIENITVAYHGQPFLQDFSLHMKRGEIISLVGESGSGKDQGGRRGAVYADLIRGL